MARMSSTASGVRARVATVLMDLLTAAEETVDLRTRGLQFDVALLSRVPLR
jgi:hypothetical protein